MSAESPRHARAGGPLTVPAQPPADRSIIDAVSGFINDVKLTSSSTVDPKDVIQWARFETADINEPTPEGDSDSDITPLLLVLGYGAGVQVWLVRPNGEAQEVLSWRQGSVRVLRILPTPVRGDCFTAKRPLIALCDSASPGPPFCALSFISIRCGDQVKSIKFKNPILDVLANKRSVVVSFSERFAVFDAGTLEDRMAVTTCYPCPCPLGGSAPINPLALGDRWLAYADKKLNPLKRSSGGCEGEGQTSYTATVLHAAKSLGKGLRGLGESVAHSLAGTRAASQSPSPPNADHMQPGIVTVLDIEGMDEEESQECEEACDGTVCHFPAHCEPVSALQWDASGLVLVTADRRGHDFHVFRVNPHPCGPALAAAHHLYVLHRGDTTARVQDIAISGDCRWAAVSTLRGTTHVFALSPYGGAAGVRTHTHPLVVNRLSRFHRSAGLPIQRTAPQAAPPAAAPASPVCSGSCGGAWFPNPRLPPFPMPVLCTPLAQLRPTPNLATHTITRTSAGRQRLSSTSEDSGAAPLLARATWGAAWGSARRSGSGAGGAGAGGDAHHALYLMSASGTLLHLVLHPRPASNVPKEKICDETPIEVEVEGVAQWSLARPSAPPPADLLAPLPPASPLLHPPHHQSCGASCVSEEERWLSQVEIVTHAGPHRRLWMGPQFVFKTYNSTGSSSSLSEAEAVEVDAGGVARSNPVNMPAARPARPAVPVLVDSGSNSSLEQSPVDRPRRRSLLCEPARAAVCDVQLREDLAEAMREDHGWRRSEGEDSRQERGGGGGGGGVALAVDPLGCVVRARVAAPPPRAADPDAHTRANADEATFRPVARAPPAPSPPPDLPARPLPRTTTIPVQTLHGDAAQPAPAPAPAPRPLPSAVLIPAALSAFCPPCSALDDDLLLDDSQVSATPPSLTGTPDLGTSSIHIPLPEFDASPASIFETPSAVVRPAEETATDLIPTVTPLDPIEYFEVKKSRKKESPEMKASGRKESLESQKIDLSQVDIAPDSLAPEKKCRPGKTSPEPAQSRKKDSPRESESNKLKSSGKKERSREGQSSEPKQSQKKERFQEIQASDLEKHMKKEHSQEKQFAEQKQLTKSELSPEKLMDVPSPTKRESNYEKCFNEPKQSSKNDHTEENESAESTQPLKKARSQEKEPAQFKRSSKKERSVEKEITEIKASSTKERRQEKEVAQTKLFSKIQHIQENISAEQYSDDTNPKNATEYQEIGKEINKQKLSSMRESLESRSTKKDIIKTTQKESVKAKSSTEINLSILKGDTAKQLSIIQGSKIFNEKDFSEMKSKNELPISKSSSKKQLSEVKISSKTEVTEAKEIKQSIKESQKKEDSPKNEPKSAWKKEPLKFEWSLKPESQELKAISKTESQISTSVREQQAMEIKTEDQAWDLLLNEPEKPVLSVSPQSTASEKSDEMKPKSKKSRKIKKSQDEAQNKSEDDSFVEIHAIDENVVPFSGELVSISMPFEEIESTSSISSKIKKSRSPKNTVEIQDQSQKKLDDWSLEDIDCTIRTKSTSKKKNIISDTDLECEFKFKSKDSKFDKVDQHNRETAEHCISESSNSKEKKTKFITPTLELRKSVEKSFDAEIKDVYVIDSTKEEFPEIQITSSRSNKIRKKSPQIEKKIEEKEVVPEKPIKSWSAIAASKSTKKIDDEAIIDSKSQYDQIKKNDEAIIDSKSQYDQIKKIENRPKYDSDGIPTSPVSLHEELMRLCKRTDIMVAECDVPSELNFTDEHHSMLHDLPPLELDFGLDDFKLEVMRDSLMDVNDALLSSPICKINIDSILSSIKESSSAFNLIDLERVPDKKEKGFNVVENDKIVSQEVKADDEDKDTTVMEKSSDDDNTSPALSTDSDKEDKKLSGASNVNMPNLKQSSKSKKSRRKKK